MGDDTEAAALAAVIRGGLRKDGYLVDIHDRITAIIAQIVVAAGYRLPSSAALERQTLRAEALEEAALLADAYCKSHGAEYSPGVSVRAGRHIALLIRALAQQNPRESEVEAICESTADASHEAGAVGLDAPAPIESQCEDCGGPNPVWYAPNNLWNLVVGGPDAKDDPGGFICPVCFLTRAEAAGIEPTAWKLAPEGDNDLAQAERITTLTTERDVAQSTCTAWSFVISGLEAHLQDRIAMKDEANPQRYLEILQGNVRNVRRDSEQFLAARWADCKRYDAQITTLTTELAEARAQRDALVEAAEPFVVFIDGTPSKYINDAHPLTQGSQLARKQVTAGDFRALSAAAQAAKGSEG